jgi:hypothetical protein
MILTVQLHLAPRLMSRAVSVLTPLCLYDVLRRDLYRRVHSGVSWRMDNISWGPKDEIIYSVYFHRLDVQMTNVCTSGFIVEGTFLTFCRQ